VKRFVVGFILVLLISVPARSSAPVQAQDESTITVMAAGDIACDPAFSHFNGGQGDANYCHEKATSDLILAAHPDAVFALGDQQYGGATLAEFEQSYDPTWGRFKAITYPILGNEDYGTPGAPGYFGYFGALAQNIPAGYYSFNLGSWHVVALNSECDEPGVGGCGPGSAQEQWLLSDLAANRSQCTVALLHEPRFSSGNNGNHPAYQTFWDDLYAFGVELILDGHDHLYERFAPQNPQQEADPRGMRELIVGTGGRSHGVKISAIQPNNEVLDSTSYGMLRLTLAKGSYSWQFVPDQQAGNGKFTDTGSATCHGVNTGMENGAGPRAVPVVTASGPGATVSRFTIDFSSAQPGRAQVLFGPGPGCSGLVMTATADQGAGTTHHWFVVTGNDLPGTVGDIGITPGMTYWYETVTMSTSGPEIDNNGGKCYSVTVPKP
jgi:hypothetical protein